MNSYLSINKFIIIMIYCTIPGGAGGLISFLLALKKGHYRNNQFIPKILIEISGAMLTSSFTVIAITNRTRFLPIAAFCIGIAWSNVIQVIRKKITKIVEIALGEKFGRDDN